MHVSKLSKFVSVRFVKFLIVGDLSVLFGFLIHIILAITELLILVGFIRSKFY